MRGERLKRMGRKIGAGIIAGMTLLGGGKVLMDGWDGAADLVTDYVDAVDGGQDLPAFDIWGASSGEETALENAGNDSAAPDRSMESPKSEIFRELGRKDPDEVDPRFDTVGC